MSTFSYWEKVEREEEMGWMLEIWPNLAQVLFGVNFQDCDALEMD